ncbi:triacylglycerol lipase [Malassezia yamatoensis]|uniref:Triacylglycerol lipase n=1 Tax=Malassezia yamatoensis TaxID=253288 RepID=A0AAJ6CIE1_9BASI|nr:triacylglycerol lipase [Malassezia yamatoensis]
MRSANGLPCVYRGARRFASQADHDAKTIKKKELASESSEKPSSKKTPRPSEGSKLAQLMHHPLLYDPIRKPRLPIVLCHGLYGFDVRGPFFGLEYQYWSAALDVLRKKIGAEVLVHGVPPTGSIKERAESLHNWLCNSPNVARGQRLNFVGHSMGGLDARYIISRIQPTEYSPASLTSLATPHRGSPFMDWCNANIGIGVELIDKMMSEHENSTPKMPPVPLPPFSLKEPLLRRKEEVKERIKEDSGKVPGMSALTRALTSVSSTLSSYILSIFDQPAYAMLSTKYMTRLFNPRTHDDPNVQYFSIAARTPDVSIFHPLWLPKLILDKAAESDTSGAQYDGSHKNLHGKMRGNDGLVSVGSAEWGEMLGIMENWDHWDMRGPGGPHRIRPAEKPTNDQPTTPTTLAARWGALRGTLGSLFSFGKKKVSETAQEAQDTSWNWREAVLSDHRDSMESIQDRDPPPVEAAAYALSSSYNKHGSQAEQQELTQGLADWISSHLPSKPDASTQQERRIDSDRLMTYLSQKSKDDPNLQDRSEKSLDWTSEHGNKTTAKALQDELRSKSPKIDGLSSPLSSTTVFATSMLEMFPFLMNREDAQPNSASQEVFERFWIAICRNLYNHDL